MESKHGHWFYYTGFDAHSWFGMVYQITDTQTKMKYIGSKQFYTKIRRKPLKGKKRVRLDTKESNWKTYTGSSKALNAVISEYVTHFETITGGKVADMPQFLKKRFSFEILSLHSSRFTLSYYENRHIYVMDALIDEKYYNCFASRLGTKKDFA